jgi:hypothetical protein
MLSQFLLVEVLEWKYPTVNIRLGIPGEGAPPAIRAAVAFPIRALLIICAVDTPPAQGVYNVPSTFIKGISDG